VPEGLTPDGLHRFHWREVVIDGIVEQSGEGGSTSLSLLARVCADDQAAWARFVDLYSPLVFGWCLRSGLSGEDAADIGQEVFLAVARHIQTFRRDRLGDSFHGWLFTITRNKIRDWANARVEKGEGGSGPDLLDQLPAELDESSVWDDRRHLLHRATEQIRGGFETKTWEAFWRTTVEGKPTDVVAEELGMTRAAVYIAKGRVRRRLGDEFRDLVEFRTMRHTDTPEG